MTCFRMSLTYRKSVITVANEFYMNTGLPSALYRNSASISTHWLYESRMIHFSGRTRSELFLFLKLDLQRKFRNISFAKFSILLCLVCCKVKMIKCSVILMKIIMFMMVYHYKCLHLAL